LFRKFTIREKLNLEFRAEAANVSNTPHFTIQTPTSVPPIFWLSRRRCQISGRFD